MTDFNDPQINKHVNEAWRPIADRHFGLVAYLRQHLAHYNDVIKPRMNTLGITGPDVLTDGSVDGRTPMTRTDLNKGWNVVILFLAMLDDPAADNYDDLVKGWTNSNPPS